MLTVLYQDESLVAVDKPSGIMVHRTQLARGAQDRRTCMNILRDQLDRWVYPIHRLDRGTSGVLLFGLNEESASRLGKTFQNRQVRKTYLAIVRGHIPESGVINHPVDGLPALSSFRKLNEVELPYAVSRYPVAWYSLAEVTPQTGRMHQIRRHFAHLSHPVIGDRVYGDRHHNRFFEENLRLRRLLLFARSLEFDHPFKDKHITIRSELDSDVLDLFDRLGWAYPD